jgi:hypothetical protein
VLQVHQAGQAVQHSTFWDINDVAPQVQVGQGCALMEHTRVTMRGSQLHTAISQLQVTQVLACKLQRMWEVLKT